MKKDAAITPQRVILVLVFALCAGLLNSKTRTIDPPSKGSMVPAIEAAESQTMSEDMKRVRAAFAARKIPIEFPDSICAQVQWFEEMQFAMDAIRNDDGLIVWEKANFDVQTKKAAKRLFRETGEKTAHHLIALYEMPWESRQVRSYCSKPLSQGFWNPSDGNHVMKELRIIMSAARIKPEDLKTSEKELRAMLLRDVRSSIVRFRSDIKEGRASKSDGPPFIYDIAADAVSWWHFSYDELGLTKEEREGVNYRIRRS